MNILLSHAISCDTDINITMHALWGTNMHLCKSVVILYNHIMGDISNNLKQASKKTDFTVDPIWGGAH